LLENNSYLMSVNYFAALGECDPNWFKEASEKHSQDSHISQVLSDEHLLKSLNKGSTTVPSNEIKSNY